MAQMEMNCLDCKHIEFDNFIRTCCPNCESTNITTVADEDFNYGKDQEMDFEIDNGQEDQA
jgi:Zn finger protein HypA/HybF involved in hydrogenase expression